MDHHTLQNTDKPARHETPSHRICRVLHYLKTRQGSVFLRLALGIWIIWGDPFGLSSASDKALADDISRALAYVRPVKPAPITIVNIDYASIKALHTAESGILDANDWPLTYKDHARILKVLVSAERQPRPAAVFYDIFFERPRNTSGDMAELGRTLRRSAELPGLNTRQPLFPPIFLAGGGRYMPMSDESYDSLDKPTLATTAWDGRGDYYPLSGPLRDPLGHDRAVPATAPTAAHALYRQLCEAQKRDCRWLDADNPPPLAVQWKVLDLPGCRGSLAEVPAALFNTLKRYIGVNAPVQSAHAECLPFYQLTLRDLYGPSPKSLKPPHLGPDEPYVVLAGVTMESLNDYHQTPLYEKIAGVYLHAAATENLYRLESDYLHESDIRLFSTAIWLLVILLADQRATKNQTTEKQAHPLWRMLLLWLIYLTLIPAFVLLVYCLCYGLLDIASEGWLFMVGLILLVCPKPEAACTSTTR